MQVLTTGYWPSAAPTTTLLLPEEIRARMDAFESFYSAKYQGRRLVWAHALERCVVGTPMHTHIFMFFLLFLLCT